MDLNLAENWWAIALRGFAAVLFGIVALIWPPAAIAVLVLLFGAYAIVDGIFNLIAAFRAPREGRPWGWLAFSGVVGIITGVVTFFWPGLTALTLVLLVAWWSVFRGISEIAAAIRLRKLIEHEWLLGLGGVLAIAFGALLFFRPAIGALSLAIWIGAYTLLVGVLLIAVGFRLRSYRRSHEGDLHGGRPAHA